jgi:exosome complex component CSL4
MDPLAPLDIVVPGDELGECDSLDGGAGTFIRGGRIYASVVGVRRVSEAAAGAGAGAGRASVSVSREGWGGEGGGDGTSAASSAAPTTSSSSSSSSSSAVVVPEVGDSVLARVTRITPLAAMCEILVCRGLTLPVPFSGMLRKEHVRASEIDAVRMDECYRPGDLVAAACASLGAGGSNAYLLSTTDVSHGVVYARSEATGNVLRAASFEAMEDPVTGAREKRKVAKVAGGVGGGGGEGTGGVKGVS